MTDLRIGRSAERGLSQPHSPNPRASKQIPDLVYSLAALAVLALLWTVGTESNLISSSYLPSPRALGTEFLQLLKKGYQGVPLSTHIGVSLFRTLTGFFAGVLLGVPLGLLTGYSRPIGAMFSPIMAFVRPIPPIAFIPMAVLYFGLGELGKVVLIFFTAFNYVHVNAHSGAANIPIAYKRAAESLGLTPRQTFVRVILPGSIPQIFTGLKVAMALSWAVVVAAELTGAQAGLGYMISDAALLFRIPVVFIGIALIGLIGLILNLALNYLEHKIVHWKGR